MQRAVLACVSHRHACHVSYRWRWRCVFHHWNWSLVRVAAQLTVCAEEMFSGDSAQQHNGTQSQSCNEVNIAACGNGRLHSMTCHGSNNGDVELVTDHQALGSDTNERNFEKVIELTSECNHTIKQVTPPAPTIGQELTHVAALRKSTRSGSGFQQMKLFLSGTLLFSQLRAGGEKLLVCSTRATKLEHVLQDRVCVRIRTNQLAPRGKRRKLTNMLARELNVSLRSTGQICADRRFDISLVQQCRGVCC